MALSDQELNDRYAILRLLDDDDPFATTYVGQQIEDEQPVLIREYFPHALAERTDDEDVCPSGDEELFQRGLRYFLKEGEVLAGLDHPNLRREQDQFRAHGTAYRVSVRRKGLCLKDALEKSGRASLEEEAALTVVQPVLKALRAVHEAGLLHGGLSLKAVYVTRSRKVLVQNFRSAHLQLARKTGQFEEITIAGMSPPELYALGGDGQVGPWTDVYGAAALLYRLVVGERLPDAGQLSTDHQLSTHLQHVEGLSKDLARVLQKALVPQAKKRLSSAQQFRELLEEVASPGASSPSISADEDAGERSPFEEPSPFAGAASSEEKSPFEEASSFEEPSPKEEPGSTEKSASGGDLWGPAAAAAAAAEAARKGKKKARLRQQNEGAGAGQGLHEERTAAPGRAGRAMDEETHEQKGGLPVSNRVAMGGGAFVLVALLVGAVFLIPGLLSGGSSNAEGNARAGYADLVAEADSLYQQSEYQRAASLYRKVQEAEPRDEATQEHVAGRLATIKELERAVKKKDYQSAIRRGTQLAREAEGLRNDEGVLTEEAAMRYEQATAWYRTALSNRPEDSLARARMKSARKVLEEKRAGEAKEKSLEEERQRAFERYRDQGDEALENEDIETARRRFTEALDYKPDNAYVKGKLDEIEARSSEAQKQEEFRRYRRQGNTFFEAGNYSDARREYQLALDVKPGDSLMTARLDTIKRRLAQQQEQQQQYQYYRVRGDIAFDDEHLERAIENYQQALEYRPEDSYAQKRLKKAQQQIAASEKAKKEKARRRASRINEDGVYEVPDEEPVLVGGLAALHKRAHYPTRAREKGVEGRVYVRATISETGEVLDVNVLRGIGYGCDREAMRAVRESEFRPGTVDGKPVRSYKSLRVQFQIK